MKNDSTDYDKTKSVKHSCELVTDFSSKKLNIQINKDEENISNKNYLNSTYLLNKEKEETEEVKSIELGDVVSMKNSMKAFNCYAIIANIFRTYESNKLYCQVFWLIPTKDNFVESKFKIESYKILPFKNDTFELSDFTFVQKVPKDSPYKIAYALNGESIEENLENKVRPFDWNNTCFDFLKKDKIKT